MSAEYYEILQALYRPTRAADFPQSLAGFSALLAALDDPQRRFPAVVVTGSTGKGTTCAHLAAQLQASGLRVGLYSSPHLHLYRERFSINGAMITREAVVQIGRRIIEAAARLGAVYGTFEYATALAFLWFAQEAVDVVVLEVGIGGRYDAVNVADTALAVFTPIEAEHLAMLGGSVDQVAWHKAGIMRAGGAAVSVTQTPEVAAVLSAEAAALQCDLAYSEDAALIESAFARLQARGIAPDGAYAIVPTPILPARLETVTLPDGAVLIDGGHTPRSAARLRGVIDGWRVAGDPVTVIIGMLRDKQLAAYLAAFDVAGVHVIFTATPSHRAADPAQLAALFDPQCATCAIMPDTDAALNVRAGRLVVAGSFRLAAYVREYYGVLSAADREEATFTQRIFNGVV